ncbi:MAG: hypothetical protein HC828_17355, partial [Blastochloris sp.]|nr:hypothetical protein [Blastochloris sp.]
YYLIDGVDGQRASIFEYSTADANVTNIVGQAPPPLRSADGTYQIIRDDTGAAFRRLTDNVEWRVETGGAVPSLSSNNSRLLWTRQSEITLPGQNAPNSVIWISDPYGEGAREVASNPGASAQWLDADRLLISTREGLETTFTVYDAAAERSFVLGTWQGVRGLTIAPGGSRLMFYLTYGDDSARNGIYIVDTIEGAEAQHMSWFGAWRWRDADRVYYIPFEPDVRQQTLFHYDISTGESRQLTDPAQQPVLIANGDWSVSADGRTVAFWNAYDFNVWLAVVGD